MSISIGKLNELDSAAGPLTAPKVQLVPEQMPAKVVTANVVRSILLIALFPASAMSA
jgi:hypothetical protein